MGGSRGDFRTGLAAADVFSFGSLVGETGDSATTLRVNALDLAAVKRALNTASTVTGRFDFNRDGRVNALDVAALKQSLGRTLAPAGTTAPASAPATNGETAVTESPLRQVLDDVPPNLLA